MTIISASISQRDKEFLDILVKMGSFTSRSSTISYAIQLLREERNGGDKQQKFMAIQIEEWTNKYGGEEIWPRISEERKKLDGYRCVLCKSNKDLRVHHIKPLSKGGTNELTNLLTVCKICHQRIHPNNPHLW